MDKKLPNKNINNDHVGFEEFIEGQTKDSNFLPKGAGSKKHESGFEHFTFLTNDGFRLTKIKKLLNDKLPFSIKFSQGNKLLEEQKREIEVLKEKLFDICDKNGSSYQKSIGEIFDSYFGPTKKSNK